MSSRVLIPPVIPALRSDPVTSTRLKPVLPRPPSETVFAAAPQAPTVERVRRLLDAGRADRALAWATRQLAEEGDSAELWYWLGRAAFALGDYRRAQVALARAAALAPADAEPPIWLARTLLRRGNPEAAMRVWSRASRSDGPRRSVTSTIVPGPFTDSATDEHERPLVSPLGAAHKVPTLFHGKRQ